MFYQENPYQMYEINEEIELVLELKNTAVSQLGISIPRCKGFHSSLAKAIPVELYLTIGAPRVLKPRTSFS